MASDDYDVTYTRNDSAATDWTNAGAIMVVVTAKADSDCSGTVSAPYTIDKAQLSSLKISPTASGRF